MYTNELWGSLFLSLLCFFFWGGGSKRFVEFVDFLATGAQNILVTISQPFLTPQRGERRATPHPSAPSPAPNSSRRRYNTLLTFPFPAVARRLAGTARNCSKKSPLGSVPCAWQLTLTGLSCCSSPRNAALNKSRQSLWHWHARSCPRRRLNPSTSTDRLSSPRFFWSAECAKSAELFV